MLPQETLFGGLNASADGLSSEEAGVRLGRYGLNVLREGPRLTVFRLFLRQFKSPLVLILIFAAGVSLIVQDWIDAGIVLVIIFGSATLSFFQEHKAAVAVEKLRNRVRTKATVLRDKQKRLVPSDQVVPGDIVFLSAGSLIPADCVVLEANDLFVTQSNLTGESFPVEKRPGLSRASASLVERTNCIYMGTSVRSGTGRAVVARTGAATVYGAISNRSQSQERDTDFERSLKRYGYLLTQIMLLLVLAVFASNVFLHRPPVEALFFAIALAVGMSPELLPAIISVTLAKGAAKMMAQKVIVQRLSAIETLGSMTVLCADKTGTLTQGLMNLDRALDFAGEPSPRVLQLAYLNAKFQSGMTNPIDDAIVARCERDRIDLAAFRKTDEIPYDFVRKRLSVVVSDEANGSATMVVKGAVDNVLSICDRIRRGAETAALTAADRTQIAGKFAEWSRDGYRVLALAGKSALKDRAYTRDDEHSLVFEGFLLFLDPPKEGIRDILAALSARNIRLKIITGDNRLVAAHIADAVGLDGRSMLTGGDLDELRDEALWRLAEDTQLFVEVDPNQKERIIRALQKAGQVVGYLGDGINDAPALQAADVGISVDQAADVAKESADFVLLEHDLGVLRQGIDEGRVTFANTLKYISITTSANFGNMLSMAVMSLFLTFLPLLAKQILLNNFLSDIPALAIADDAVDPESIERPQRWNMRSIRRFMLTFGLISSVFDFLTVGILIFIFSASPELFRTGWFIESLLTELAILLVIRTHRPFYRSMPGRLLLASTLAVGALTLALPYLPFASVFGFIALPMPLLASLIMVTGIYVAVSEAAKRLLAGRLW